MGSEVNGAPSRPHLNRPINPADEDPGQNEMLVELN